MKEEIEGYPILVLDGPRRGLGGRREPAKKYLRGLARYTVHLAASIVPFWNVAKQPKNGSNGGFP